MPPNQLAHVMSCTPGVLRIASPWLVGIEKIIDVDRIVTSRCAELAAETASKPWSTARSAENRNTARATLRIVSAVRRLLRRALLNTRPMNFIAYSSSADRSPERLALPSPRRRDARLLDQQALLEVQQVRGALGRVRVVRHHHDRLLVFAIEPLQ